MSVIGAVFAVAALGGPLLGGWLTSRPGLEVDVLDQPAGGRDRAGRLPGPAAPADPARVRQSVRAADLLPVGLLRSRTFACVAAAGFLLGLATFGLFGYLPTYLQLGRGLGPVESGLWMLTLVAGLAIGTLASAQLVSRTGVHRPLPVVGALLAAAALGALAAIGAASSLVAVGACFVLLGLGVGLSWEVLVVIIQNSVAEERVGAATALNGFSREVGVLLGSALVGGMVSTRVGGRFRRRRGDRPGLGRAGRRGRAGGRTVAARRTPTSVHPTAGSRRAATSAGRR